MRSILFVPGNKYDWILKSIQSNADGVVIDLEDAVAPQFKESGRKTVKKFFDEIEDTSKKIILRINPLTTLDGLQDVLLLRECKKFPCAVMLPKVESAGVVELLVALLSEINSNIGIIVIVESAKGLLRVNEIAVASNMIKGLVFGGADYSSDLGCDFTWDNLYIARQTVVLAAVSAHIEAIDMPYLLLDDFSGLENETRKSISMGFTGKIAIHPKQLDTINQIFMPDQEKVNWANRVIEAVNKHGLGAIRVDDEMVDAAIVRRAERLLKLTS